MGRKGRGVGGWNLGDELGKFLTGRNPSPWAPGDRLENGLVVRRALGRWGWEVSSEDLLEPVYQKYSKCTFLNP